MANIPLPDLAECANEPIRVPGAIQPQGRLLALDARRGLLAWSANWGDRAAAEAALALTGDLDLEALPREEASTPSGVFDIGGERFDVLAHRSGDRFILEFEPSMPQDGLQAPIYTLARHFLRQLEQAPTMGELCQRAARQMKQLTGFGRCLVYRFDENGHGEVLAEELDAGYDSYEGHHFPGGDIPAQARELYRLNRIRLIPDARYEPVALVGVVPGFDPRSIDLSWAALRSVSPVHLEYMVNMGTLASMSVGSPGTELEFAL